MSKSVYIASAESHSGKSSIALGVLHMLQGAVKRVVVFRPLVRAGDAHDAVLELLIGQAEGTSTYEESIGATYEDVHADPEGTLATIVERFGRLRRDADAVVVVGSDFTDVATPTELAYNARIAANLGIPVLLVLSGKDPETGAYRSPNELAQVADLSLEELKAVHADLLAVVSNRADPQNLEQINATVSATTSTPAWAMPESPILNSPSVFAVMEAVGGRLLRGNREFLGRESLGTIVAAMSMENVLSRLTEGGVVIIPADRTEVLVAVLAAQSSGSFPSLAAIVLNGGFDLSATISRLIDGLDDGTPIITTSLGTYDTVQRIVQIPVHLTPDSVRKIDTALALFEEHLDKKTLLVALDAQTSDVLTPLMFEHSLIERARAVPKHIVLPEGDDDRILRAAATVLSRQIARVSILGNERDVRARAAGLGVDLDRADVVDPDDADLHERFAKEFARLRAHKGVTLEVAREKVKDVSYFGTMMVKLGLADGMVSGAAHTTAHTITPALQVIKTVPGVTLVSSVFFMALEDRVLVYGDCAIVPEPTADELADIAISSAETAQRFGIEPRVAMLSYSTGESGTGPEVDKVRHATVLVRERRPDLVIDGPMQYDAASDLVTGKSKLPGSPVAGRATVYIFPDLNTGNNTYKAVQRSSGAVAIGPILQGLKKPVNDLSRGATVRDIVNTIAITAIQAQGRP
jgi:phosphate acetyltransferase